MPTLTVDEETSELAEQLARRTGTTVPEAVKAAVRETLQATPPPSRQLSLEEQEARRRKLEEIIARATANKTGDTRSADEIIGYDDKGMW